MRRFAIVGVLACALLFVVGIAGASTPGGDVRLTNDCHPDPGCGAGYVSDYTLATGVPYTDQTLDECTVSKGRENEPVSGGRPAQHERAARELERLLRRLQPRGARGALSGRSGSATTARWTEASSLTSSLVPGYPDDTSPYAALSQARTASARRSRDRLGQPRPRVLRLGELRRSGRLGEDVWRRLRRPLRESRPAPTGATRPVTASPTADDRGREGLVRAEPARQVQRQDGDRGRPHGQRVRRQRLLLVVALHRERRRGDLLLPLDRPRRRRSRRR